MLLPVISVLTIFALMMSMAATIVKCHEGREEGFFPEEPVEHKEPEEADEEPEEIELPPPLAPPAAPSREKPALPAPLSGYPTAAELERVLSQTGCGAGGSASQIAGELAELLPLIKDAVYYPLPADLCIPLGSVLKRYGFSSYSVYYRGESCLKITHDR